MLRIFRYSLNNIIIEIECFQIYYDVIQSFVSCLILVYLITIIQSAYFVIRTYITGHNILYYIVIYLDTQFI